MDYAVKIVSALILAIAMLILALAFHANATAQPDAFVVLLEQQLSVALQHPVHPGTTVTSPFCGCTAKYVGTKVNGRMYDIRIERLD